MSKKGFLFSKKTNEMYLVEFDTQQGFDDFKKDEERNNFLHLKQASIKSSILIQGIVL